MKSIVIIVLIVCMMGTAFALVEPEAEPFDEFKYRKMKTNAWFSLLFGTTMLAVGLTNYFSVIHCNKIISDYNESIRNYESLPQSDLNKLILNDLKDDQSDWRSIRTNYVLVAIPTFVLAGILIPYSAQKHHDADVYLKNSLKVEPKISMNSAALTLVFTF